MLAAWSGCRKLARACSSAGFAEQDTPKISGFEALKKNDVVNRGAFIRTKYEPQQVQHP